MLRRKGLGIFSFFFKCVNKSASGGQRRGTREKNRGSTTELTEIHRYGGIHPFKERGGGQWPDWGGRKKKKKRFHSSRVPTGEG